MKRLFYAVFTLMVCGTILSCTNEIITDDEMSKLENDSVTRGVQFKHKCMPIDDPLPDTTFLVIKHRSVQEGLYPINHRELLKVSERGPIIDPLPDTTFLDQVSSEELDL